MQPNAPLIRTVPRGREGVNGLALLATFAVASMCACGARTGLWSPVLDSGAAAPDGEATLSCNDGDPSTPVQISAGISHTCALMANCTVRCWGYGLYGELGDGTNVVVRATPSNVLGVTDAVEVAAGDSSTCARHVDGSVSCWGRNESGQQGDGTTMASASPAPVPGLANARRVAVGGEGCSLLDDRTVACWGGLGHRSHDPHPMPTTVSGLGGVTAITTSLMDVGACAVLSDGALLCWGVADVVSQVTGSVPVRVPDIPPVRQAQPREPGAPDVTLDVLLADGTVRECTRRYETVMPPFVPVSGLDRIVQIGGAFTSECALRSDGTVWCWGANSTGQLGDPSVPQDMRTNHPVTQVVGIRDAVEIAVGSAHACARLRDTSVWCWGYLLAAAHGPTPQQVHFP